MLEALLLPEKNIKICITNYLTMQLNIGQNDQVLRLTIASIIGLAGVLFGESWGYISLYPLITGIICFDPIYFMARINTKSPRRHLGSKKQRTNHKNHF